MPVDPFAALTALVRAEAARSRPAETDPDRRPAPEPPSTPTAGRRQEPGLTPGTR
ncbi:MULTISPECIES: hypothetical protein [Streptomyces]|uniref:Uncharacterized protein n=1 Tax=Streptomyces changanensis TaxID=2964669 RepID=A0ABY5NGE7_9ACTN|nr:MULTISPECIES: hypothetical protein [Streptomyces]UUS35061.1 hypothetical protein NRO40_24980 [Streptomyces changanensis]